MRSLSNPDVAGPLTPSALWLAQNVPLRVCEDLPVPYVAGPEGVVVRLDATAEQAAAGLAHYLRSEGSVCGKDAETHLMPLAALRLGELRQAL
jgi:hypothetical protein